MKRPSHRPIVVAVIATSVGLFAVASGAFASGFKIAQTPNQFYYTLNPEIKASGPTLTTTNASQYVSEVFHAIVSSADHLAKPYLTKNNDPREYWAFLVAALAVPYHEGHYQQFRQLTDLGNLCSPINSGEILAKNTTSMGRDAYSKFIKYLHSGSPPVIPNCSTLNQDEPAIQILGSQDGLSIGVMQLNIAYHDADYYEPQKYLSLQQTIDYGLGYYQTGINGFDQIYRNMAKYSCITDGATNGELLNYDNLIRAAWSVYNGGTGTANICRIANGKNGNDADFLSDLNSILSTNNPKSLLMKELQGQDLLAYEEIVSNFENHQNSRENLDKMLAQATPDTPVVAATTEAVAAVPAGAALKSVITPSLNVRTADSLEAGSLCGHLSSGSQVRVLEEQGIWSKIQLVSTPNDAADSLSGCGDVAYVSSDGLGQVGLSQAGGAKTGIVVQASLVNVHKEIPRGSVVAVLQAGTQVNIVAEKKQAPDAPYVWYQVSPSNGWIYGQYIRTEDGK